MSSDAIRVRSEEEFLWKEYLREKRKEQKTAEAEIKAFLNAGDTAPEEPLEVSPREKKRSERRRSKRREKQRVKDLASIMNASQGSRNKSDEENATYRKKDGSKSPRRRRKLSFDIIKKAEKLVNAEAETT